MTQSLYAGVLIARGGYTGQIARKGKVYYLGFYDDEKKAAAYVDRAVLLTRAWVKNPAKNRLNFPQEEYQGLDSHLQTTWEERMLADLRYKFPENEKAYKLTSQVARTLQSHMNEVKSYFLLRADFKKSEDAVFKDLELVFEMLVARNIELTDKLAFEKESNREQLAELARLKGIPAGGFKMTPVPKTQPPVPAPVIRTSIAFEPPAPSAEVGVESPALETPISEPVVETPAAPNGVTPANDSPAGEEAPESADNTAFVKE